MPFTVKPRERELLLDIEKQKASATESEREYDRIVDCVVSYPAFGWPRALLASLWARGWLKVAGGRLRVAADVMANIAEASRMVRGKR